MTKVTSLDKKWKELLYGFSGFGPNLLMVFMGAFFTDAINPAGLPSGSHQAIMSGTCFILPAVFPILYMLAKVFDGVIDIPFAHITDNLSTRWGKRRPAIAVCMVPMILSFAMCWLPIGGPGEDARLLNTIWIMAWAFVFFASYTMCLISYYGSLATVCKNDAQHMRVSAYKSFFDTISYCIVYALVPLLLDSFNMNVDKFALLSLPLMLTIAIPLFMLKEGEKYGYPEREGAAAERIGIVESIKLTFGNKIFRDWLLVNGCTFFGMQMFLVGMNTMISGGMGFNGLEMAMINTCAFAPVPIMLYLFNKLKAKKGVRFAYKTCLLAFAVAIMAFFFASEFVTGGNRPVQYLISGGGGILASWAIGAFFMVPYLIPAQVASVEERLTGRKHSAMYFAGNAIVTTAVGAISGSLVYEIIKMLFLNKETGTIVWAENVGQAATMMGASEHAVFDLGILLVPFIVSFVCLIGFFLAFRLPKDYGPVYVAEALKKQEPSLDISSIKEEEEEAEDKAEPLFMEIGLSILSGFIFGFIWVAFLFRAVKNFVGKRAFLPWIVSCFVPFAGIYFAINADKALAEQARKKGAVLPDRKLFHMLSGVIFPILPINLVSLCILQRHVNRSYFIEQDATAYE